MALAGSHLPPQGSDDPRRGLRVGGSGALRKWVSRGVDRTREAPSRRFGAGIAGGQEVPDGPEDKDEEGRWTWRLARSEIFACCKFRRGETQQRINQNQRNGH